MKRKKVFKSILNKKKNVDQENGFEDDIKEDEKQRAKDNKHIYIRKVLKNYNSEGSSQPIKNVTESIIRSIAALRSPESLR